MVSTATDCMLRTSILVLRCFIEGSKRQLRISMNWLIRLKWLEPPRERREQPRVGVVNAAAHDLGLAMKIMLSARGECQLWPVYITQGKEFPDQRYADLHSSCRQGQPTDS